jgi:hypothetical protein
MNAAASLREQRPRVEHARVSQTGSSPSDVLKGRRCIIEYVVVVGKRCRKSDDVTVDGRRGKAFIIIGRASRVMCFIMLTGYVTAL